MDVTSSSGFIRTKWSSMCGPKTESHLWLGSLWSFLQLLGALYVKIFGKIVKKRQNFNTTPCTVQNVSVTGNFNVFFCIFKHLCVCVYLHYLSRQNIFSSIFPFQFYNRYIWYDIIHSICNINIAYNMCIEHCTSIKHWFNTSCNMPCDFSNTKHTKHRSQNLLFIYV